MSSPNAVPKKRPFNSLSFVKYMNDSGRAYRERAIQLIRFCRLFVLAGEQSVSQDTDLRKVIEVVDEALSSAGDIGSKTSERTDSRFEEAMNALDDYERKYHPTADKKSHQVAERMKSAKEKDKSSSSVLNKLKGSYKEKIVEGPTKVVRFILGFPGSVQSDKVVMMVLDNKTNEHEILWNFSRLKGDQRVTLKQNPHFYRDLSRSAPEYRGHFTTEPIYKFWHETNITVLTDRRSRVFLETHRRRAFGNFWVPNEAIIFKDIRGRLEGEGVVAQDIEGIPNLWHREDPRVPTVISPAVTRSTTGPAVLSDLPPIEANPVRGRIFEDWRQLVRDTLDSRDISLYISTKDTPPSPGSSNDDWVPCQKINSEPNIASYKTEMTIRANYPRIRLNPPGLRPPTPRQSPPPRQNTPPQQKYAGIEHLNLPQGPVSEASVLETDLRDESDQATKTTRTREESMDSHQSGPHVFQEYEASVNDIIRVVRRFRILSIGRSGVGKSSLINSVFGINAAHVEEYKPGEADIQQADNQLSVLHDSKVFEPGDLSNFDTVRNFIQRRSRQELPLSERIHALWLCTETPTAGGRVFETEDEKLLQFAHQNQVPILIVFTQYDQLVRTKGAELRQNPDMEATGLHDRSLAEAQGQFGYCLKLLERSMGRLGIPMPPYAKTSARPGYREDVSDLVQATRDLVKERIKGDAWVLWAIAQRKNLPLKIDACVIKAINYYKQALMGTLPVSRQLSLHHHLERVHNYILTCWDFEGKVLNSPEFRRQILCHVQEFYAKPSVSNLPDGINQFSTLVTSAPIPPPDALPRLTNIFERWLLTAAMENTPSVQRLLIAYTVDLISVLRILFDITLRVRSPGSTLTTTWTELREAFEAYELSRKRIRTRIHSKRTQDEKTLTEDDLRERIRELLQE